MPSRLTQNLKTEFYKHHTIFILIFVFFMTATFSFFAAHYPQTTSAASLARFNPGNIISDAVMGNYASMSVNDIQKFLKSKNNCNNRDYSAYLEYTTRWPNITWHWEGEPYNGHFVCMADELFDEGEEIGTGKTAAQIIYDAAQEYRINPQVLLVLLEKESSLITDTYPNSLNYRSATGYGCPDTAACSSKYYGFKNQIYNAAELFRYTLDNGSITFPEKSAGVYIGYNPTSSCGGSTVWIENRATAALYRYTPYQPNTAALNAGYGTGDGCSAYGNRNFYLYFVDWFGNTQAAVDGEVVVIPDGEYSFVSQTSSSRVLGVSGDNIELDQLSSSDSSQRWNVRRDSYTGYYEITNSATGKVLSIADSEANPLANVVAQSYASACTKQWRIYRTKDNYLTFETACVQGMVIDVDQASSRVGTNIQLWLANGCSAQKWRLYTGETLAPGNYTITASSNSSENLDLAGGSTKNGTNVQLWETNHDWPQHWQLAYDSSTGTYTVKNPRSGKLLDLAGASTALNANIQVWQSTGSCAQQWKIVKTPDSHYTLISNCAENRTLDLVNGSTANGTNIRLWEANNADAQKWDFSDAQPIPDGTYTITAKNDSGKNLDLAGGVNRNGTNIQLWETNGEWPQDWQFHYDVTTDTYTIASAGSGHHLLDLAGANTNAGTNIQLWASTGSCAQRWYLRLTSDGYYNITSDCNTARAVDLVNGTTANGTNIRLWSVNGADAQKWSINPKS